MFFGRELAAVTFAAGYSFVITSRILFVLDRFFDVRLPKEVEVAGLDRQTFGEAVHGD